MFTQSREQLSNFQINILADFLLGQHLSVCLFILYWSCIWITDHEMAINWRPLERESLENGGTLEYLGRATDTVPCTSAFWLHIIEQLLFFNQYLKHKVSRENLLFIRLFKIRTTVRCPLSLLFFYGLENSSCFLIFSCLTAFPWIVSDFSASLFTGEQTQCPVLQQRQANGTVQLSAFCHTRKFFL